MLKEQGKLAAEADNQQAVWKMAMTLFSRADTKDRAGEADKPVAQLFYTAMCAAVGSCGHGGVAGAVAIFGAVAAAVAGLLLPLPLPVPLLLPV